MEKISKIKSIIEEGERIIFFSLKIMGETKDEYEYGEWQLCFF